MKPLLGQSEDNYGTSKNCGDSELGNHNFRCQFRIARDVGSIAVAFGMGELLGVFAMSVCLKNSKVDPESQ